MADEKLFPLQVDRGAPAGPLSIPWSVAEVAYGEYARRYGTGQSLDELARRGGFGWGEMDLFHPRWREEAGELARLRAQRADLLAACEAAQEYVALGCAHATKTTADGRAQAGRVLTQLLDAIAKAKGA